MSYLRFSRVQRFPEVVVRGISLAVEQTGLVPYEDVVVRNLSPCTSVACERRKGGVHTSNAVK